MKRIFGKRGEGPRFLFALLAAFLTITVCSKSSFLYPFNDWVDVNCFFTVGRGILHGLTPYRDLYEQKGPLTYLLFALAAAVSGSGSSVFGVAPPGQGEAIRARLRTAFSAVEIF